MMRLQQVCTALVERSSRVPRLVPCFLLYLTDISQRVVLEFTTLPSSWLFAQWLCRAVAVPPPRILFLRSQRQLALFPTSTSSCTPNPSVSLSLTIEKREQRMCHEHTMSLMLSLRSVSGCAPGMYLVWSRRPASP